MIIWRRLSIVTEGSGEVEIAVDSESIRFQVTEISMSQAVVRISHEDFDDVLAALGYRFKSN